MSAVMELRYYQREAVDAIFDYWAKGGGNPLIDLATGTGKSLVIATLCKRLIEQYPDLRILMLVHVRELVQQNAQALLRAWPQAPVGINSAGLGRRDKHSQILYASIQSVAKESAETIGERHLILIDEAHLVPKSGAGQYLSLIERMRESVPDLRIAGTTATPYRLDSGRLDQGDDSIFDDVVYEYGIAKGVEDGFLSPLVSRMAKRQIDVSGVARRGGEFVSGALEAACDVDEITQAACDEIVERGQDRRSWLTFCTGVKHSKSVRDALQARGISCEVVTGETPKAERAAIFNAFKAGKIRALAGCNVFSTGFDAPNVDMISLLRPTLSTSLYVQQLGRGTRIAEGKQDCLILDFSGNVRRHGPVDAVEVRGKSKSDSGKVQIETVRAKECPSCEALVSLRTYTCPYCAHEWERPDSGPKHDSRSDKEAAVMTREIVDQWLQVDSCMAYAHTRKDPPTMRVEYYVGATTYTEWVCLEHKGFAGAKAEKWWRVILGTDAPTSVEEGVSRFRNESPITDIQVKRDGKYWRVCAWRVDDGGGDLVEIDANFKVRRPEKNLIRKAS